MNFKEVRGIHTNNVQARPELYTTAGVATTERFGHTPLEHDWWDRMTPIEQDLWDVTRHLYTQYLIPQWPVNSYFLDFANPIAKIAFECDGKQWHDAERDFKRDTELRRMGWTVYRFPGSVCHKQMEDPSYIIDDEELSDLRQGYGMSRESENYVHEFLTTTLDGFMECFMNRYFALGYPELARSVVQKYLSPACRGTRPGKDKSEMDLFIDECYRARCAMPMFDEYIFCMRAIRRFGMPVTLMDFTYYYTDGLNRDAFDTDHLTGEFLKFMDRYPGLWQLYRAKIDPRTVDSGFALYSTTREAPTPRDLARVFEEDWDE